MTRLPGPASFRYPDSRYIALLAIGLCMVVSSSAKSATFDHSSFNALLSRAVSNGRVNYGAFRNNASFVTYLSSLGTASLGGLSRDEQLAFWINAYNACVIKNVLDHPGMKKPTDITGFFDRATFKVAGRMVTLNNIENDIIRPTFKDPLIHFGLVCAARSCPPLTNKAYTGRNVRQALGQNASRYLASSSNRYDAQTKTLWLSKIFDWYSGDFGGTTGILKFVSQYGTQQMTTSIAAGNVNVKFLEYDWTLNGQ